MSSFFTASGGQKKRKRPSATEAPKKRPATSKPGPRTTAKSAPSSKAAPAPKRPIERDESISGSDLDSEESGNELPDRDGSDGDSGESEDEGETAAEKRLRLAQRYLEKTKQEVEELDEYAFDAEQIDRDLLAERLEEDVAEAKGRIYRQLAAKLDFDKATHSQFRWNSGSVTSVAVCAPYAYTATKDGQLTKWRLQDLPKDQWPQTTKKKPKKPPAPPKKKPERICSSKSDSRKAKDKNYQGHTGAILTVRASQDGKFVVTGGTDRRMVIHSADTLKPLRAFSHHRDAVTGLAFRRGTNQLYSCSKDRTVKVWSLDELAYIETLFGHQDEILDIDALAQERCVSVGARDRTARYWKVPEESQLVFRGGQGGEKKASSTIKKASAAHQGSMDRVSMIDDELFVTGSDNGDVALWSIHRKKAVYIIPHAHGLENPLLPTEISADADPDPALVPAPQPRSITALRTIPYSDVILSGSWDGCVRVWRLSQDKKKIEPVGVLGTTTTPTPSSSPPEEEKQEEKGGGGGAGGQIRGIINDIALFERGDRGKDGLCVVIATGKEMRLGRWKVMKEGKCGAVVFEVPRVVRAANGVNGHVSGEEDGDEE
ncbi:ribosomal RNA-processing protein 9 [Echria macrotheca]|uniref:Ribosomal RNA-processing protein 9 n=1 Tax=Echria macrotheca TaxID=438768 RepID=A0AAJ0BMW7_9PEZI|nr:ribosomal RNA-processing protein 9 [Echria macrotheca]